jgi:hypothetical protein
MKKNTFAYPKKLFEKLYNAELSEAERQFYEARKAYIKAMKDFVIKNVTDEDFYDDHIEEERTNLCSALETDHIDDVELLGTIIEGERCEAFEFCDGLVCSPLPLWLEEAATNGDMKAAGAAYFWERAFEDYDDGYVAGENRMIIHRPKLDEYLDKNGELSAQIVREICGFTGSLTNKEIVYFHSINNPKGKAKVKSTPKIEEEVDCMFPTEDEA